jgi:gelsolin|eukprot:TRINITY_DN4450_c2_g3_i1.p2 TRINITY_DN4450_c2_g3~~TRINITY_DN4450_c2_g3_i1.p2  ORF type:complete len:454 (+),score=302.64 TRINITY_DN4450_c2_g3_i1:121-1362(+)
MPKKVSPESWKDTNVGLIGSDIDRKVKEASAGEEDAWKGCGEGPALRVWRIEQFKVVEWPEKRHGEFHSGDSYIVLHSRHVKEDGSDGGENDPLAHDVYFWIGSKSSQDEYGTAAYKTVEVDTFLKDAAVQHRELERSESEAFLDLFSGSVRYLAGGVDSGFNHVEPESYGTHLLHVKGRKKNVVVTEEPEATVANLNAGDCFVVDAGTKLTAWFGAECNKDEKARTAELMASIKAERSETEVNVETIDQGSETDEFWAALGGKGEIAPADTADAEQTAFEKVLFRLSDKKKEGKLTLKKEAEGALDRKTLDSEDVFIVDDGFHVFVYIGKEASKTERTGAMEWAARYIRDEDRPANLPVTRIVEGQVVPAFEALFAQDPKDKVMAALGDEKNQKKVKDQIAKLKKKKKCAIQ